MLICIIVSLQAAMDWGMLGSNYTMLRKHSSFLSIFYLMTI